MIQVTICVCLAGGGARESCAHSEQGILNDIGYEVRCEKNCSLVRNPSSRLFEVKHYYQQGP